MKQTVCLLLLCAASAASAARPASHTPAVVESPWFCHDLDCPTFTLVKNITDDVQLRQYAAGKWASTVVTGVKYDKAVATGFWRLFKYISGNNEQEQKVEMTAPVTVRVTPSQGPFCEDNFTISFFVPFDFQSKPPQPSAEEVYIESRPALEVYVASFSGWATGSKYVARAAELTEMLEDAGHPIEADHFYTAGYDSPFRLLNRHNEVWILAGQQPSKQQGIGREAAAVAAA
eukprot:GHRQ01006828.1.p1 GENE.GHRQ01006828.1~~GHRQ01006828.1.p1  ORF type:complete len:232 (+),score=99.18 GHRQ01006828.1:32-727(+)